MKVYAELRKVLLAFSEHSLPVVVLKGAALAERVYRHIGLRTMADVDLLLEKKDLPAAAAILEKLGFKANESYQASDWYIAQHHHLSPYTSPDGSMTIELHWHVIRRDALIDIPIEEMWSRVRHVQIASVPACVMAPEHLLFHVAVHLSSDNIFVAQVRGVCDVAEMLHSLANDIDWDELVRIATLAHASRHMYLTLVLAQELFGAELPHAVLAQLERQGKFLPLERKGLRSLAKHAVLVINIEEHFLYEWIGLDIIEEALGQRSRSGAMLGVARKVSQRFAQRLGHRWQLLKGRVSRLAPVAAA
jgi:hypothetical protein